MSNSQTATAYSASVENAASAHPSLRVSLPTSFLAAKSGDPDTQHTCTPYLLIKLPPGLFLDPHTFPIARHAPSSPQGTSSSTTLPPGSQGRDLVKSVEMLNGTTAAKRRLKWDFTSVELEKPMGYSLSNQDRATLASGKTVRKRKSAEAADDDALIREYNAALISLFSITNLEAESGSSSESHLTDSEIQDQSLQNVEIVVPLHTRYPIPVTSATTAIGGGQSLSNILQATAQTLSTPSRGMYRNVMLEYPHAISSCSTSFGQIVDQDAAYQRTTSDDLLAPEHTHLALPDSLQSRSTSSSHQLYSLAPALVSSREPFRLRLPMGQADLAVASQTFTMACLLLASLYLVVQTKLLLRSVVQVENKKKASQ